MGRVLVTGATGFIGLETVRQLVADGERPRAMVRRLARGPLVTRFDVEPVVADLTRPASLQRAVEGCDTVIHLAGRATMEPLRSLRPTLVDGTRLLAEAAAEAGVEHIVFGSSLLVHGEATAGAPIDASTPVDPQVDYGHAKVLAERALLEVAAAGGPTVSALRLPHVYGAGDLLFARVHRGLLVTPGRGDNLYAHLHVEDAARVAIAAARRRWSGVSAVADDEPATWRRFWGIAAEHFAGFRHVRVPASIARAGAALAALVDVRGSPSMVTPDTVRGYNLDQPVAPGLLRDELGVALRHPTVESGVPAVLDSSVSLRWQHPVDDRLT